MDRYSTITLKQINNIDSFFRMVDRCSHPVYVTAKDQIFDLKKNDMARSVMKATCSEGWRGILDLKVSMSDAESVMNYML